MHKLIISLLFSHYMLPILSQNSLLAEIFDYSGDYQYYSLPSCANGLFEVHLWGAGGSSCCSNSCGGAGAYVTGRLRLNSGNTTVRIIVGRAGVYEGGPGANSKQEKQLG